MCETPPCEVITFTQGDSGGNRCPGCGFVGHRLRTGNDRPAYRRLAWLLLGRAR